MVLLLLLTACAPRVTVGREVGIRVADGSDHRADLDRVIVTLHDAAFHPAGQPRDEGWVELELTTPTFELGAGGRDGQLVARGKLPPGMYDRVRVEVADVVGERQGQRVAVRNIVEPIYLPRPLAGGPADVRIEFIVLPLSPGSAEPYAVYVKGVTIE